MPVAAGTEDMMIFATSCAFIDNHAAGRCSTGPNRIDDLQMGLWYPFSVLFQICRSIFTKDVLNGSQDNIEQYEIMKGL